MNSFKAINLWVGSDDKQLVDTHLLLVDTPFIQIEEIRRNKFNLETECSSKDHSFKRKDVSHLDLIGMSCIEKCQIESIFLIGIIDHKLIELILSELPKLNCLNIRYAKFTAEALNLMYKSRIGSKLEHLSTNGSIIKLEKGIPISEDLFQLLKSCDELKYWRLLIRSDEVFNDQCLSNLSEWIKFLYLKIELNNKENRLDEKRENKDILKNIMKKLSESKGNGLEFLRIEFKDEPMASNAFCHISKLSNLRGLNLSVRNEIIGSSSNDYKEIAMLQLLETFTIDFFSTHDLKYDFINAKKILEKIYKPNFKESLERLQLINAVLTKQSFNLIYDSFINLNTLLLKNCLFLTKDIEIITELITQMNKLTEITVEITGNRDQLNCNLSYLSKDNLKTILENSEHLEDFCLITNKLSENEINSLKSVTERRPQISAQFY